MAQCCILFTFSTTTEYHNGLLLSDTLRSIAAVKTVALAENNEKKTT